jgi:hypothetical protein
LIVFPAVEIGVDRVYDESGYRYFLYQHDPDPPLNGDDDAWATSLLPQP